jgi:hypothetical protein
MSEIDKHIARRNTVWREAQDTQWIEPDISLSTALGQVSTDFLHVIADHMPNISLAALGELRIRKGEEMDKETQLPGEDVGADVTAERNLEDQRISMAYQLGHLTFAELVLLGNHIPGADEIVDPELTRRVSLAEISASKPYRQARLANPDE